MKTPTTEIPAIIADAKAAGCENADQINGYLAAEVSELRAAIQAALEMHLGRCASSEPFKAADYRHHACEARDILRAAWLNPNH